MVNPLNTYFVMALLLFSDTLFAAEAAVPAVEVGAKTPIPEVKQATAVPAPTPVEVKKSLFSKEAAELPEMVTNKQSGFIGTVRQSGFSLLSPTQETGMNKEMWFSFGPEINLKGYKSRTLISEGDEVDVLYQPNANGSGVVLTAVILKKNAPPKEEVSQPQPAKTEGKENEG